MTEPRDIAVLAYFRIAFGLIAAWEMWRFLEPDHRWVDRYFTNKDFYFKFWPFAWVDPLPEPWIHVVFWVTGLAAVMVALGLLYRVAATVLFLGLAYIFLLEQARYLNHFYLIVLISFLMIWVPANRSFSLDARLRPALRSETTPAWALWLLQFQVAVPYFFGGIAKINADWLRGEPLRAWLADRTDFPVVGGLFVHEPMVWFMTYGALFFDLFVVFGLLHRRTRPWAFLTAVVFHIMNSRLFGIGVFPWFMLPASLLFFDPSWPRQLVGDLRRPPRNAAWRIGGFYFGAALGWVMGGYIPVTFSPWKAGIAAFCVGVLGWEFGSAIGAARRAEETPEDSNTEASVAEDAEDAVEDDPVDEPSRSRPPLGVWASSLLFLWVAVQVIMPLRHFAIPGKVHWTEEGHNFAWHMKLRDKDSEASFVVRGDGVDYEIDNRDYLNVQQERKMSTRPHMMVEYAHYLEDDFEERGFGDVEVRAEVWASLNGREEQLLIDPTFDLTTEDIYWAGHAEWILPLEEPL